MKLYFKDLPCYRNLTPDQRKHSLYAPKHAFDLSRLPPTDIRNDFAAFIYDRAEKISYLSLRSEQTNFHNFADFITDTFPEIEHLTDLPLKDIERRLRVYLLMNEERLSYEKYRSELGKTYRADNPMFYYLRAAYNYFLPKEDEGFSLENDIWKLESLPFPVRDSPIKERKQINFSKIRQEDIKKEIKDAALYHLKRRSVSYVSVEIMAVNFLSEFLQKSFPEIISLKDFSRELLEEYLSYLYLESKRKKDYRTELSALKSIFIVVGKLYSYDNLKGIFLKSDFSKHKRTIYKSYSDAELQRLHAGYKLLDKQTARLLLIHELLGLRISDTMTLKKENVFFGEKPHVKICQPKTGNTYEKTINEELCSLLKASIEETTSIYGDCDYIFVSDKDPTKPLTYASLSYRFRTMVQTLDLLDDNGKPFTVGTHLLRHTYGKHLCDLFADDATIAALLGHKSISSVAYYRQMSPKTLAESTKPVIDARNEKIKKFKKGWME